MSACAEVPIVPAIKLRKILYATDFSEASRAALPVASAIARHYGSELVIANVCPNISSALATPEALRRMDGRHRCEATKKMKELLSAAELAQLSPRTIIKTGDAVAELQAIIGEQGIDLVVLSTHGRTGFQHLLMGSVAEMLFRHLTCPVLTIGPHLAARFGNSPAVKNILFPTDFSEESQSVFPYLASLADENCARITVLHVLPPETESNPDTPVLAEPLRKQMEHVFLPQISRRCEAEFVIDAGEVLQRILAQARARDAELIGFGIRKAAEVTTHFRNTVAYRAVIHAECLVLTYRSHRFWND
jgi:nucleotide-binding universal stress UspA family protein